MTAPWTHLSASKSGLKHLAGTETHSYLGHDCRQVLNDMGLGKKHTPMSWPLILIQKGDKEVITFLLMWIPRKELNKFCLYSIQATINLYKYWSIKLDYTYKVLGTRAWHIVRLPVNLSGNCKSYSELLNDILHSFKIPMEKMTSGQRHQHNNALFKHIRHHVVFHMPGVLGVLLLHMYGHDVGVCLERTKRISAPKKVRGWRHMIT